MPVVKLIGGIVWGGEPRNVGDEIEVTEIEAYRLIHGYKKAVRVDGKTMEVKASGMLTQDVIATRDPVAEHRDPVAQPAKRKRG